jgi:hypothetical protein
VALDHDNQLRAQAIAEITKTLSETHPATAEGFRRRAELEARLKELRRR